MYRQSHENIGHNYIPLAWVKVNQILENKFYTNLGKVDDRIPILQLTRSRSKKQKKTKKTRSKSRDMVLNQAQDSKIRLENNRHILECYKLNCDQLVYMHHTRNLLDKKLKHLI